MRCFTKKYLIIIVFKVAAVVNHAVKGIKGLQFMMMYRNQFIPKPKTTYKLNAIHLLKVYFDIKPTCTAFG